MNQAPVQPRTLEETKNHLKRLWNPGHSALNSSVTEDGITDLTKDSDGPTDAKKTKVAFDAKAYLEKVN